jgi:hypothetical protein
VTSINSDRSHHRTASPYPLSAITAAACTRRPILQRRAAAHRPKPTPRYFHRHCRPSKLLELKNPRPNRPSRAYKRAGPAPHLTMHHANRASLPLELSIATTSAAPATTASSPTAGRRSTPPETPAQGKEQNRLPSSSSSFCPTSRPSPCTGSPAPLPPPPVGLPVYPLLCFVS